MAQHTNITMDKIHYAHTVAMKKHDIQRLAELNRKLHDDLKHKNRREHFLTIINEFSLSLFKFNTIDEVLWGVCQHVIAKLKFEDCVIYLLDEKQEILVQRAAFGPKVFDKNTIINPLQIKMGVGIVGHVAQSGKAEIIENTLADERYIADDSIRQSEICVPIVLNGKIIGVIDAEHSEKGYFEEEHLEILSAVAHLVSLKYSKILALEQYKATEKQLYTLLKNLREEIYSPIHQIEHIGHELLNHAVPSSIEHKNSINQLVEEIEKVKAYLEQLLGKEESPVFA